MLSHKEFQAESLVFLIFLYACSCIEVVLLSYSPCSVDDLELQDGAFCGVECVCESVFAAALNCETTCAYYYPGAAFFEPHAAINLFGNGGTVPHPEVRDAWGGII